MSHTCREPSQEPMCCPERLRGCSPKTGYRCPLYVRSQLGSTPYLEGVTLSDPISPLKDHILPPETQTTDRGRPHI